MKRWTDQAFALIARGEPVALITLTQVHGSAPREAGARMLVWADGQCDTIGGGNLEFMIVREARVYLDRQRLSFDGAGGSSIEREYPLGPILGQCCGGKVAVRIEHLDASRIEWLKGEAQKEARARAPLILFGAGHVGEAIARAAAPLPFRLFWYDTRPDFAHEATLTDDPRAIVAEPQPRALFLIITHNHDLDYELVRAVLSRRDAAYCGLIGSHSKRKRFERQLRADGLASELRRLTCPIGGAIGLKGKTPAVIAAATIAELMLVVESQAVLAPEHAGAE